jgi:hypothetical protein
MNQFCRCACCCTSWELQKRSDHCCRQGNAINCEDRVVGGNPCLIGGKDMLSGNRVKAGNAVSLLSQSLSPRWISPAHVWFIHALAEQPTDRLEKTEPRSMTLSSHDRTAALISFHPGSMHRTLARSSTKIQNHPRLTSLNSLKPNERRRSPFSSRRTQHQGNTTTQDPAMPGLNTSRLDAAFPFCLCRERREQLIILTRTSQGRIWQTDSDAPMLKCDIFRMSNYDLTTHVHD